MMSATTIRINAAANVIRMPEATASGCPVVTARPRHVRVFLIRNRALCEATYKALGTANISGDGRNRCCDKTPR